MSLDGRLPDLFKDNINRLANKMDKNSRLAPAFVLGTLTGVAGNIAFAFISEHYNNAISWLRHLARFS
jgi:hypothetical protein